MGSEMCIRDSFKYASRQLLSLQHDRRCRTVYESICYGSRQAALIGTAFTVYPVEAVIFCVRWFIQIIAPFVVPVLTGICGFVAASIPPKGGTTNTVCKNQNLVRILRCGEEPRINTNEHECQRSPDLCSFVCIRGSNLLGRPNRTTFRPSVRACPKTLAANLWG